MLVEQRPVSRKTPLDGKLEISATAAARIAELGAEFPLAAEGKESSGRLESVECACAKGAGERHVHHFVVSPVLQTLAAGKEVRILLDEIGRALRVESFSGA